MDEQAFEGAVRQHQDMLFRIGYTVLHNSEDCADALQDALIRAWRNLPRLRDERAFRGWMARIVINCSRDILRRRRLKTVELTEEIPVPPARDEGLGEAISALEEGLRLALNWRAMFRAANERDLKGTDFLAHSPGASPRYASRTP